MNMRSSTRKHQKGSALVEACLCLTLFWTPLFIGTYQIGFNLIRAVQVTQICRDAGHMYSLGTDFSQTQYQNLLKSLMPASMDASSSGNTIVYLSTITYLDASSCASQNLTTANCPNYGKVVLTRQIPIGNTSVMASHFGTPACPASSAYNCTQNYYVTNSLAVAHGFGIPLANSTQFAYVSEMFVQSRDLSFFQSLGTSGEY